MPRRLISISAGVVCSMVLAGTVLAEGSWDSWMQDVLPGFESRSWEDKNLDAVSTSIRFDGCRDSVPGTDPNDWASAKLMREIPWWPDENLGNKFFWCWNSDTNFWGDVPASWYHFTVTDRSGPDELWNNLDVSFVRVVY